MSPDQDPQWLVQLTPDTPLNEALATIVEHRLSLLVEHCSGALDDAETVHQLRVWSRRLTAALEIVQGAAPDIGDRKVLRWLKKIRQLCGQTRDLDVRLDFIARLREQHPQQLGLTMVEELIRNQRSAQQPRLQRRIPLLEAKLRDKIAGLLIQLDEHGSTGDEQFGHTAGASLKEASLGLWKVAAPWLHHLSPAEASTTDLHSLRISAKEFRYVAELFTPVLPETFRHDLYPQLQEMQSILGDIQDSAASAHALLKERRYAEETLVTWFGLRTGPSREAAEFLDGIDTVLEAYAKLAEEARKSLAEHWLGFIGAKFREPVSELVVM